MFKKVLAIFLPIHLPVAINICIISVMNSTLWHLNTEVKQLSVNNLELQVIAFLRSPPPFFLRILQNILGVKNLLPGLNISLIYLVSSLRYAHVCWMTMQSMCLSHFLTFLYHPVLHLLPEAHRLHSFFRNFIPHPTDIGIFAVRSHPSPRLPIREQSAGTESEIRLGLAFSFFNLCKD